MAGPVQKAGGARTCEAVVLHWGWWSAEKQPQSIYISPTPCSYISIAVVPGGGAQGGDEGLQKPPDEHPGVSVRDDEVEQRQDAEGMDEEPNDDGERVHPQLASHHRQVIHLQDFASNQEHDPDRSVPVAETQGQCSEPAPALCTIFKACCLH